MYKIQAFEVDEGKRKLFVSYSEQTMQESFDKFKKSIRKEKNPTIKNKLFDKNISYETAEEAEAAVWELTTKVEGLGYKVIAGTPLQRDYWQVYAIELDNDPAKVYVGQSIYSPEIRLEQHKAGMNSSVKVRRANNPKLRPDLYSHIAKLETKEAAMEAESKLIKELKDHDFTVYGGRK